ncbi:Kinesin-like protein KIF20B [Channa argus]|uniref:Kinesin-like protein KIF20B n=1 Tax=Channa argus TaxID=215402 RepID=A0A6G1QMQ1_CHAAH|nr:Kinesin-like protein KIF20B [Channa argus]
MMETCLAGKPERVGPVEVDDIKKDLLGEFSALPTEDSVQSQSENLQVYLRVRPFTAAESNNAESRDCVVIEGPDTVVLKAPRSCQSARQSERSLPQTAQRFTFTKVFGPEASQRVVFDGSVRDLVQDVLEGGNCLVFTYGVTNAGKTFTFLGPDHDSGLLPRSLSVIFNSIEGRLYSRADLKPQRCRDFSRLTQDQQAAEASNKKNLLRLLKESDKSVTSKSTFLEGSSLTSDSSVNSVSEDSFCLDVSLNVRFSVWVSFCEIYNDNIHDLLEQVSNGHHRRTVLRLSQDVKGNSFIKDLRWVQVNSSEEAYRVMKIGKKNQSFSSTRLNQLSSRSHSIFSIRILRVDDVGVPRILGISELSLCDLAGSERCSRTHNTGERLKEAGNINSSLLTLGKCINAMRLNQHAKIQHHIPFRESKLTHFLQFFFCGAGRVSMVVNINQNASCFDETLNVLKFSALAQKVVVLNSRPVVLHDATHSSAMDLSVIIDEADRRRNVSGRGRKSSLVAWETTLEDVLEDEDEEEEEEESAMEGTVLEACGEEEEDMTMEEEEKSDREAALRLVLEAQIREEVSSEFMELFNKMEKDYSERLEKEREILEERAEKRIEILKNLVSRTVDMSAVNTDNSREEQAAQLAEIISSMTEDLEKIKADAQSVHHCLTDHTHNAELEALRLEKQQSHDQLQEAQETLEQQRQKLSELIEICQQKDQMINKLQATMDSTVEDATRDRALVESIKSELQKLQQSCHCLKKSGEEEEQSRKRHHSDLQEEEKRPAKKRMVLEEEIWRLHEENDKKEESIQQLMESRRELEEELRKREAEVEEESSRLRDELRTQEEEVEELKKERVLLEQKVQMLTDLDRCVNCESVLASLESEQRENSRLTKENKALVNGIFQLQTEKTSLQGQLREQTDKSDSLLQQLITKKTHLQDLENQSEEKKKTIDSLTREMERLRKEVKEQEEQSSSSSFHAALEELKRESQAALQRSAQKSQEIQDLQRNQSRLQETLTQSETRCSQLTEELTNRKAEFCLQLQSLNDKMERLEEKTRREKQELQQMLIGMENDLKESHRQAETLRGELRLLKEEEEKENRNEVVERKVSVVQELTEVIQSLEERRGRRKDIKAGERPREEKEDKSQSRAVSLLPLEEKLHPSPLQSIMAAKKKTPKTVGRKRKSWELEDLVFNENKRNKGRGNGRNKRSSSVVKNKRDETLEKLQELIHSSPAILSRKAKNVIGLVNGQYAEEAVSTVARPRRGRKNLYKTVASSLMLDSPNTVSGGAQEEKESDHLIIKRQLRSKTCRK